MNREESESSCAAESADRRQFLRNAMKIGGAAALLLTAASRKVLAGSLQLDPQELGSCAACPASARCADWRGALTCADGRPSCARLRRLLGKLLRLFGQRTGACSAAAVCSGGCTRGTGQTEI